MKVGNTSKILLVNGGEEDIKWIHKSLSTADYDVIKVNDTENISQRVSSETIDLVLLKSEKSGFEVCRKLKEDEGTNPIPVVLIADSQEFTDMIGSVEAGADDILIKPFGEVELLMRIKSLLRIKKLEDELKETKELANKDGLTGVYNHRYFVEILEHELLRSARYNRSMSLFMIDIDHFKAYNDNNGHPAGDRALVKVAEIIKDSVRKTDITARYGGEEFSVILPEIDKEGAVIAAERVRQQIEKHKFPNAQSQPEGRLTVSIGLATFPGEADSPTKLVAKADEKLYLAKQGGRNRIVSR